MPQEEILTFRQFKGLKNDEESKQIPYDFFNEMNNFNYPDDGLLGIKSIQFPQQITKILNTQIDGLFEYRYLDQSNILQTESICVTNGAIFKNVLSYPQQTIYADLTFNPNPANTIEHFDFTPYNNGDTIYFWATGTATLPPEVIANKVYYVVNSGFFNWQISETLGGTPLVFTTAGTDPHTATSTRYVSAAPVPLKQGLNTGRVSMTVYKDKLFIANGYNYVNIYDGNLGIVTEMGAPYATVNVAAGNVDVGTHYYAMTYVVGGTEDVIGSVSNTITVSGAGKKVDLVLPIGFSGTTSRKIYRTKVGATTLYLLATIADNTTTTYQDNTADIGLGAQIPALNNELPKPFQIAVANQCLYGTVVSKYPTQVFKTNTNVTVWDTSNFIDVSNYGNDNTPIAGMGIDFSNVIIGTGKNIYILQLNSDGTTTVIPTRANVGFKDRFGLRQVPAFGDFPGGLMFVSTLNDVRMTSGINALPVSTSINNVRTDNWAQDIRGSLNSQLIGNPSLYTEFYQSKFHLVVNDAKFVFDIRTQRWTYHNIQTTSYRSQPRVLAVIGEYLYNGQPDGWIEKEYQLTTYRGQTCPAYITSPEISVNEKYKQVMKMSIWVKARTTANVTITITTDSNDYFPINTTIDFSQIGFFNSTYFNSTYFSTSISILDYKVVNINIPCRWFKYRLQVNSGNADIQRISIYGQTVKDRKIEKQNSELQ